MVVNQVKKIDAIDQFIALPLSVWTSFCSDIDLRNPFRSIDVFLKLFPCKFSVLETLGVMGLIPAVGLQPLRIEVLLTEEYLFIVFHLVVVLLLEFLDELGTKTETGRTIEWLVRYLEVTCSMGFYISLQSMV